MEDKSSEMLCVFVILYRLFKMNRDDSIVAMEELQRREAAGDDFDYKMFIDDNIKKIQDGLPPAPNLSGLNIIQSFMKGKK
jgi:hypothetical protein